MRVTLLLAACVLASCTALRVGYNHGESVVYWWMNAYLDFDADQQPWVRKRIGELLAWHRRTQLKDQAAIKMPPTLAAWIKNDITWPLRLGSHLKK